MKIQAQSATMKQRRGREVQASRDRRGAPGRQISSVAREPCFAVQRKKPPEGGFLSVKKYVQSRKPRLCRGFLPYDRFQFSSSARR